MHFSMQFTLRTIEIVYVSKNCQSNEVYPYKWKIFFFYPLLSKENMISLDITFQKIFEFFHQKLC